MAHIKINELINKLQSIDKRRYTKTPFVSSIESVYGGGYIVTLVESEHGGSVKRIEIEVENNEKDI